MSAESERLQEILESKKILEFFSAADKEHGDIQWTVCGAIETNEVIVRATINGRHFYRAAPSPLVFPPMADRIFGIDVMDDRLAQHLSGELWQSEGETMLRLLRTPE